MNLVYKYIKAWNWSKIKKIVVISLVSLEGFGEKMTFLYKKQSVYIYKVLTLALGFFLDGGHPSST